MCYKRQKQSSDRTYRAAGARAASASTSSARTARRAEAAQAHGSHRQARAQHGEGDAPPTPAGQYDFAPGEEIQHDTSPHELELAGKKRKVQTASAVLCYSRMLFFQCYPTFRRFDCKLAA